MAKKRKKRNPRKHVVTNHLGTCYYRDPETY